MTAREYALTMEFAEDNYADPDVAMWLLEQLQLRDRELADLENSVFDLLKKVPELLRDLAEEDE